MKAIQKLCPPLLVMIMTTVLFVLGARLQANFSETTHNSLIASLEDTEIVSSSRKLDVVAWRQDETRSEQIESAVLRPLFVESRDWVPSVSVSEVARQPENSTIEPLQTPKKETYPDKPDVTLLGYIQTGNTSAALVSAGQNEDEQWVSVGDTLTGWLVSEIREDSVQLTNGEHVFVVEIVR